MTKSQKRVLIAKDVLKQLRLKRFKASPGTYLAISEKDAKKFRADSDHELQEDLKLVKKCEVCALGACFVATVERFDRFKTSESDIGSYKAYDYTSMQELDHANGEFNVHKMKNHLSNFFPVTQLRQIEAYFEGWNLHEMYYGSDAARAFKLKHPNPTKRMAAIMRNIVRNEGTFRP